MSRRHFPIESAVAGLVSLLLTVPFAAGGEPAVDAKDEDIVAVFRFSGQMLESAINRDFTREEPFAGWILDAYGDANVRVEGKAVVNFANTQLEQPLTVDITGRIRSSAVGYRKAFVTGARTYGSFETTVGVDFDGRHFVAVPTQAHVRLCSTADWVKHKRMRIGRRLVQRIGTRMAPRMTPRYDREAERMGERQIPGIAAKSMEPILAKMNEALKIEQTLAALAVSQGYSRRVSKTEQYLQVRVAPDGNTRIPPKDEFISNAPIEIWVYPVSKRPALATALVQWQKSRDYLAEVLPKAPKPPVPFADKLKITQVGDWDVIQVTASVPEIAVPGIEK